MLQGTPSLLAADVPACCPDEAWKPLPGWPHEVGTCGRARSISRIGTDGRLRLGALLPIQLDKRKGKGYEYVDLRDGDRRRRAPVAVIVLEAHDKPRPGPGYEACHQNDIRTDNHRANLEWDTRIANLAQMWERRRRPVTGPVTGNPGKSGRNGAASVTRDPKPQDRRPRPARYGIRHSHGSQGTGRFPFLPHFPSFPLSLNPSIPRPLRGLRPRPKDPA